VDTIFFFCGKSLKEETTWEASRRWTDNTKIYLAEVVCDIDSIRLAKNRAQSWETEHCNPPLGATK
jgi:hypothetical protein